MQWGGVKFSAAGLTSRLTKTAVTKNQESNLEGPNTDAPLTKKNLKQIRYLSLTMFRPGGKKMEAIWV